MEIINKVTLEITTGENRYCFGLPAAAPLGEIHDALHAMKQYVANKIAEQAQKEQSEQETPEQK